MTKSKEEQEQEQAQAQEQARQAARLKAQEQQQQRSQVIASPQSSSGNVPPPTFANVSNTQPQTAIKENIAGDQQATKTKEDLDLLKRLVGKASPVNEDVQETREQKDANGNVVQVPVSKKVTKGYTYYSVNGVEFEKWVEEAFGGDITVDTKENRIVYNKPIEEINSKEVNFEELAAQRKKETQKE